MKYLFIITALLGIFFQTFNTVGILASYQINKEFIIKNLCENKNKPQMHCNGKCHLKKQLANAAKKEQSPSNQQKTQKVIQLFSSVHSSDFKPAGSLSSLTIFANKVFELPNKHSLSIFHPPQTV